MNTGGVNEGAGLAVLVALEGAQRPLSLSLQFLEQKYGYFHCKDCKTRWESAYVWCISGSNKVVNKSLLAPETCKKGTTSVTNWMFWHKFRYLY